MKTATYGLTALTPAYAATLTGTRRTRPAIVAGPALTPRPPAPALGAYVPPKGLSLYALSYAVTATPNGTYTVTAPGGRFPRTFTGLSAAGVTALLTAISAATR